MLVLFFIEKTVNQTFLSTYNGTLKNIKWEPERTRTRRMEVLIMERLFFSIAGLNHYYGKDFLKSDMKLRLVKEPDNEFDKEAIKVEMDGLGKIGYVANSPCTTLGESMSAGRLYDRISDIAWAEVRYVTDRGVVGEIVEINGAIHNPSHQTT